MQEPFPDAPGSVHDRKYACRKVCMPESIYARKAAGAGTVRRVNEHILQPEWLRTAERIRWRNVNNGGTELWKEKKL